MKREKWIVFYALYIIALVCMRYYHLLDSSMFVGLNSVGIVWIITKFRKNNRKK